MRYLPFLALLASLPARADTQLYAGLGLCWTPGAEHAFGPVLDASYRTAPGERAIGPEIGAFSQLRFPGFRQVEASIGGVAGLAWLERADFRYSASHQLDAEAGIRLGGGAPPHLHLGAAAATGFGLVGTPLVRLRGRMTWVDGAPRFGGDLVAQSWWLALHYYLGHDGPIGE